MAKMYRFYAQTDWFQIKVTFKNKAVSFFTKRGEKAGKMWTILSLPLEGKFSFISAAVWAEATWSQRVKYYSNNITQQPCGKLDCEIDIHPIVQQPDFSFFYFCYVQFCIYIGCTFMGIRTSYNTTNTLIDHTIAHKIGVEGVD